MNKTVKGLLAALSACTGFAHAAIQTGSTFIAHRDELADLGTRWTISNHLGEKKDDSCEKSCKDSAQCVADAKNNSMKKKKCAKPFGARFDVTGFYNQNTNYTALANYFGMGTPTAPTGTIVVTPGVATASTLDTKLFNTDLQHTPNSDGLNLAHAASAVSGLGHTTDSFAPDRVPAYGTVNLSPRRQSYGAYLGWTQSLDALLDGLAFTVRAPIVQVRTSMRATLTNGHLGSIPAMDGKSGYSVLDYFDGSLTSTIDGTNTQVNQRALTNSLVDDAFHTATGLADLELGLNYTTNVKALVKGMRVGVGAVIQIPTGNDTACVELLEPIYGARGHIGAGATGLVHFDVQNTGDVRVGLDFMVNWKYFFKGTELRTMGVYDLTDKIIVPMGRYKQFMQNGVTGVQPGANVLTANHAVTPKNQVNFLAGVSAEWKNFGFNLGYELYWHQKESVTLKDIWVNDKYAFAHPHYSMQTGIAPTNPADTTSGNAVFVYGGTSYLTGDAVINDDGGYIGENDTASGHGYDFSDTAGPVTKHGYLLGSNGDAGGTPLIIPYADLAQTDDDLNIRAGAYTSLNGPIQASGVTTSSLLVQAASTETGVNANAESGAPLTVRYNVSSLPAVTGTQLTHNIVGGVSYKLNCCACPIIVGIGGKGEFQPSGYNTALAGYSVWGKVGISF